VIGVPETTLTRFRPFGGTVGAPTSFRACIIRFLAKMDRTICAPETRCPKAAWPVQVQQPRRSLLEPQPGIRRALTGSDGGAAAGGRSASGNAPDGSGRMPADATWRRRRRSPDSYRQRYLRQHL